MGAATVAIAFAQETSMQAIWIEASWYDMARIVRSELARGGFPQNLATAAIWAGIAGAGEREGGFQSGTDGATGFI